MNENIAEIDAKDISLSSFKPQDELHPKFWPHGMLNSRVRLRLLDIADDFIKELSVGWVKPKDVVLTGSIANYNWSRYSDVDIHIIYDYKEVYPKSDDFVDDYFKAKKENWLSNHEDLKIFGFPVEISVEDDNSHNPSTGRYSLFRNCWIVEPNDFQDAHINAGYIKHKAASMMTHIDSIEKKLDHEDDRVKCEKYGDRLCGIFRKLKRMRSDGLASDKKEMSSGNIIYKIIRHAGYIDKIWDLVNDSYDRVNSIDERDDINEAQIKGRKFAAGIIPFRRNKNGNTEVFLAFPGQPKNKSFVPPPWMNRWQIMKGRMNTGEDPLECAVREFSEESGIPANKIDKRRLVSLGSVDRQPDRALICYGWDVTGDNEFDKNDFHSNPINLTHYINLNGGKPYPEMADYSWHEVNNIKDASPYETHFYGKCDNLCKRNHMPSEEHLNEVVRKKYGDNGRRILITEKQRGDIAKILRAREFGG